MHAVVFTKRTAIASLPLTSAVKFPHEFSLLLPF